MLLVVLGGLTHRTAAQTAAAGAALAIVPRIVRVGTQRAVAAVHSRRVCVSAGTKIASRVIFRSRSAKRIFAV